MSARHELHPRPPETFAVPAPAMGPAVLAEHRLLRRLLQDVEDVLLSSLTSRIPVALSARLADLELALDAHFSHEERAGLFEEIVAVAPETTAAAAALLAEHGRIRRRVAALRLRALRAEGGTALANAVRRLLRDVASHERRENALVLETVATVVAAQD